MKRIKLQEERCCECGEVFVPLYEGRTPEELAKLDAGEQIYCRCPNPNHPRYTMGVIVDNFENGNE